MFDLNHIILKRLGIVWLSLSLIVASVVWYVETKHIDETIIALAAHEAARFVPAGLDLANLTQEQIKPLHQRAMDLVQDHFIVVEVYNTEKKKLFEAVNPNHQTMEKSLAQYKHSFPLDREAHYQKHPVDGNTVVQVLVPLIATHGGLAGYFEGVFIVDPATLAQMTSNLRRTLVFVLLCVLVTSVVLYPVLTSLNQRVIRFSQQVVRGNLDMATALGAAIALRDSDTSDHNFRVTLYAIGLAETYGSRLIDMRSLILGAFLHDVGKIGISDTILLKPGKLTGEEFEIMKTHVKLGVNIVANSDWLQSARDVIECHHEKFNGEGYLHGLSGEDIPLTARIFAIVDVFDALTSRRPYKEPMPFDQAMQIIERGAGNHFDPRLVSLFQGIATDQFAEIGHCGETELSTRLNARVLQYFTQASLAVI